jgi:hypothetical protein
MILWYNRSEGIPAQNGAAEWTERLSRRMATRRFHAIHSAAPILFRKKKTMAIRGTLKALKETPVQAFKISIVALLVAITALVVSLGKRFS